MKPVSTDEVLSALNTILKDSRFKFSPHMSAFLKYVVIETLHGRTDRIKAYTVALEALGKPITFDAQLDPSVRVLACRLRRVLKLYYRESEDHKVVIELNPGSYVPKFNRNLTKVVS